MDGAGHRTPESGRLTPDSETVAETETETVTESETVTETVTESETVTGFTSSRRSSRTPDSGFRTPDRVGDGHGHRHGHGHGHGHGLHGTRDR